jgi:hypothetical protein
VGEAVKDSGPDGAPEWWWFTCSGGVVLEVPLDGDDGVVVTVPLGGGGGGHTANPDSGESGLASLAPILGARVLVGRPSGAIQIHAVYLYDDLGGVDSGIGRDDFDRFIIFVYNGDHDHVIFFLFGDSFSFSLTR